MPITTPAGSVVTCTLAPFVVADACGDRDPRPHEASLFDLGTKYTEVLSEDAAIKAMTR